MEIFKRQISVFWKYHSLSQNQPLGTSEWLTAQNVPRQCHSFIPISTGTEMNYLKTVFIFILCVPT